MDDADRELVRSGLAKRAKGEKLTQREARALKNFEALQLDKQRDAIVQAIPKGLWCEWSGRQPKVVNEQAHRYRLPLLGRTVNLKDLARALHDFLAANAKKLAGSDADDPLLAGAASPALELYRQEKYRLARLDRLTQEGKLLRLDDVRDRLVRIASILRQAGELIEKQHGREASDILNTALDDAQTEIDALGSGRDPYDAEEPDVGDLP